LVSLGDYVWLDKNGNGLQDSFEEGINDLEIKLYLDEDANGNPDGTFVQSVFTISKDGSDGFYIFENLRPGNYIVQFPSNNVYDRTVSNVGGDQTKDSDANIITGLSKSIHLISGDHNSTIDAGYYSSASIGDFVWYDEDGDGVQDENEKCIDSVKIILYIVNNNDGVLDSVAIDTTWSHAVLDYNEGTIICGFYNFVNLSPGNYFLVFENPSVDVYHFSPKGNINDDSKDSDINDLGFSSTISLEAGEKNKTIDAGLYKGECLKGILWKDREEGYFELINGVKMYTRVNVHDIFDLPYTDLVVDLYLDPNEFDPYDNVLYKSVITNEMGEYEFENIKQGKYFVVINLPDTITVIANDIGGDDSKDNDFYLSEESGMYRSNSFPITVNNNEECVTGIDGGTKKKDKTQEVDIISFNASWNALKEVVQLEWNTMNEINLDNFIIERRADEENAFKEIDDIIAIGGRNIQNYGIFDNDVDKATTYHYKLIPVDLDGVIHGFFNSIVNIPQRKLIVESYPNPVSDKLIIVFRGERVNDLKIELIDNFGRSVLKTIIVKADGNNFEKVTINFNKLPQGQYFVKVISGEMVEVQKIVHIK